MYLGRSFQSAALAASILGLAACAGQPDGSQPPAERGDTLLQSQTGPAARDAALARVQQRTGGAALISMHKATGAARFVRVKPGSGASLADRVARSASDKAAQSAAFFRDLGAAVGVASPDALRLVSTRTDALGKTHLTYKQVYGGLPVFGATLKTHFDVAGRLVAVAGTAIPDIDVPTMPTWTQEQASAVARAAVVAERGDSAFLHAGAATLLVFREGLAQGVPGDNHLAWQIEVTDDAGVRDLVFVGALSGKVIDRIAAVEDAMFRRAYDGKNLPRVPDNYPQGAFWLEGQRFPTLIDEANNMIISSKEVYDFYHDNFGRDSFDDQGAKMDAIFDRGYGCPNASWNGVFISFCPGLTTDDVTAHEWSHAYTEFTDNLIYQWQPGALNEATSDIWGETVDRINGRGGDTPDAARTAGACSTFSPPVGTLRVNAPAGIAGDYFAQSAQFGSKLTTTGITGEVVAALDAADATGPSTLDGCTAITNAAQLAGKIALINRGSCEFSTKVLNAQNAGAVAVIIANNVATGLPGMGAGAVAAQVTIPSLGVQQSTGAAIRAQLTAMLTVNATLLARPGTDDSVRWLIGEDAVGGITGALRDMWNPTCYSNPGKVSDTAFYTCATGDNGGVHTNSGVPNHGYALLVDGGTYNGQTVAGVGLTKAAHIYFRAQDVYQVEDTDFADHADALAASCQDLVGSRFPALGDDPQNGPITADDCAQLDKMILAVELRGSTAFCKFPTLLDPRTAASCSTATTSGGTGTNIAIYHFDTDPLAAGWTVSHDTASTSFTDRDWTWTSAVPVRPAGMLGSGPAFFANGPNDPTCASDEAGVLHLTSPPIFLDPATTVFARATFEHWISTEAGFDGGNLKLSVNGGPWQLVPASRFAFNGYNLASLFTADQGNTDPLAGQPAWSGTNSGSVTDGSWGRTHVDLGDLAAPGDTVQLRWDLGTDRCVARAGWYVDEVRLFSCTPKVPVLTVADVSAKESAGELVFTLLLSTGTIRPVAVTLETVDGTAVHGNDYTRFAGTVVIPASTATQTVRGVLLHIPLHDDTVQEGDEYFTLRILGVTNATLGNSQAIGTIVDDDTTPPPR